MKRVILLFSLIILAACDGTDKHEYINLRVSTELGPDETVHVVGTFNNWQFETPLVSKGSKLTATLPNSAKPFIFNFVKNQNWQSQPSSISGKSQCPHLYLPSQGGEIEITIENWLDQSPRQEPPSTITGAVDVLPNFTMPELARQGDIFIYIPPSYKYDKDKKYPVLYMLDGQNIFNEQTSYSDEWQVDEILERMSQKEEFNELIVVAISNGPERWDEYTPWDYKNWSGEIKKGKGKRTFSFILNTLKPFIDQKYRTEPNRNATGIAGSSLGGLMAIYAAMEHSETFGFVAAFFPSLAITNPEDAPLLLTELDLKKELQDTKIYLDIGELEYGNYDNIELLHKKLIEKSANPNLLKLVKDDLGRHCELDWKRRFPKAISWLFKDSN